MKSERIIQNGKKKMVLDHLIVQKMDDEESAGDDLQSILTYGAKALFNNEGDQSITCAWFLSDLFNEVFICFADTELDIEKLIEKTEKEGDQEEVAKDQLSFSFAKVWAADKDTLEDVVDEPADADSWAQTLQQIAAAQDQNRVQEVMGRGVRRRATVFPQVKRLPFLSRSIVSLSLSRSVRI
jgi:chromodomain-helicase-DNA-binding protein 4